MAFQLLTERLIIRDFIPEDLPSYLSMVSFPDYQKFYDEVDCSEAFSKQLIEKIMSSAKVRPRTNFQMALCLDDDELFIGTCGLRLVSPDLATMGVGIDCRFHHNGYALEAAEAMMAFGFEKLEVNTIVAESLIENKPAIQLCKRLGMYQSDEIIPTRQFKQTNWQPVKMVANKEDWVLPDLD